MNRPIAALSVFAVAAAMSAACSGHTDSTSAPPAADTSDGVSLATPKPAGHTGDTLNLTRADGSTVTVTLDKVINPATVTPGPSDPGITYFATQFTIANPGTATVNGDINTNVWAFGSDGQRYAPNLKDVGECTNFDAGMFHIAPGGAATGCVVFALPAGVSPAKVRYAPSSGFADGFGEWLFPSPSRATPFPSVN